MQDLLIYDEEGDQLKHISFEQALFATGVTEDTAGVLRISTLLGYNQDQMNALLADEETMINLDGTKNTNANKALAKLRKKITVEHVLGAVKAGVWVPICITIVRPFIEHLMMSTVCTVSGRDTGATLFGPAGKRLNTNARPFEVAHTHTHTHTYTRARVSTHLSRLVRWQTCRFRPTRA